MHRHEVLEALVQAVEDARLSRGERRALREVFGEANLSDDDRRWLRRALIDAVAERLATPDDRAMVEVLADAVGLLATTAVATEPARVLFGPEDPMVETLLALVAGARRTLDLAVFTLTDDRLADGLVAAKRRGVTVLVLTDNDKQYDQGSDVFRLRDAGLAVVEDDSPYHFHHKFAVIDGRTVITGSYNWTRGADRHNRENILISHDPDTVAGYAAGFARLWAELDHDG